MDLQIAPSSLGTAALGSSTLARQRSSLDLQRGTNNEFSSAMQSALGSISATLQEVKTALNATPQAQQRPELAEVFKGFGVLMDQLAQAYGGTVGGAAPESSSSSVPATDATRAAAASAVGTAAGDGTIASAAQWASALTTGLGGAAASAASAASTTSLANRTGALPGAADSDVARADASAPVTWESYSASAAYLGAKSEYLGRIQQNNPTDQWIVAALNKAIEQSVANGYDPEKSHAVNTLRGYFSGDAQARSRAIQSLDDNMLKAGGAYETFDYGLHTVAGAPPVGMNTTMPTFKSAYDKDWDRPSLYDMINSSLGWAEKTNSFADPASRDAALNRKLSDAEIMAFQNGSLTPELQALVTRYRGG